MKLRHQVWPRSRRSRETESARMRLVHNSVASVRFSSAPCWSIITHSLVSGSNVTQACLPMCCRPTQCSRSYIETLPLRLTNRGTACSDNRFSTRANDHCRPSFFRRYGRSECLSPGNASIRVCPPIAGYSSRWIRSEALARVWSVFAEEQVFGSSHFWPTPWNRSTTAFFRGRRGGFQMTSIPSPINQSRQSRRQPARCTPWCAVVDRNSLGKAPACKRPAQSLLDGFSPNTVRLHASHSLL